MRNTTFSKRLIAMRTARGLTQSQLEEFASMPTSLISQYETGQRSPGLGNIEKLCAALQCTATELIGL